MSWFKNDAKIAEKEKELDLLIEEVKKERNSQKTRYTVIKEQQDDFAYWENVARILDNDVFQWMMFKFKENILSQLAKPNFLSNTEQVVGAIKTVEYLLASMEKMKYNYTSVIEAERNAKTL